MSVAPDTEASPTAEGKRLTLVGTLLALLMPLCLFLLFAAWGVAEWTRASKGQAGLFWLFAASQLMNVPSLWKRYNLVKHGVAVYVSPQPSAHLPKAVSVVVVLILTGVVGVASAFTLYVVFAGSNTLTGWAIGGSVLLSLWLFTGYFWYRILNEKRPARPATPPDPQNLEGIWPPAPAASRKGYNEP